VSGASYHGHAAVDQALFTVYFCWCQPQLIGIGGARFLDPHQDVLHFFVVANQLQQWPMFRARLANAEQILGRGVERLNQQAAVDDDDGRIQAVEDLAGPWRLSIFLFSWG